MLNPKSEKGDKENLVKDRINNLANIIYHLDIAMGEIITLLNKEEVKC
jgi:hypothetical protein